MNIQVNANTFPDMNTPHTANTNQPTDQVARKGETVNLLIDLFWMAMTGSRWGLAFPDTVRAFIQPTRLTSKQK